MDLTIELDREEDGRWFAYIEALPGVIMYGPSKDEAITAAKTTALRVIADRIEHGEHGPLLQPLGPAPLKHFHGTILAFAGEIVYDIH